MLEIENKSLAGLTFIDLFAGLGGFRLALESLGARCVYSNDFEPHVREVYRKNFGEIDGRDIREVDAQSIPDSDIIGSGIPCQSFSVSGKKLGFKDERGTLFFEVARITEAKRPKVVFIENVKNLVTHDNGRTLEVMKRTMNNLDYDFNYKVLNAADYGIPQKRERVYIVCFRKDLGVKTFTFPKPIKLKIHLEDILLSDEEVEDLYIDPGKITFLREDKTHPIDDTYRLGSINKGRQGERIYSIKGEAITLSATGGGIFSKTGGYLVNGRPRKLHPKECARLMGFFDAYILDESPSQAYQQFGNSVVVDVLQYIAIEIGKALEEAKKIKA